MKSKNPKKEKNEKTVEAMSPEQAQQLIEELTREKDDLFEKLQRISADYSNYQKRTPKQITDSVAYQKEAIMRSLLPSLDNFEHALAGAQSAQSIEDVVKGVKMVFDHMLDALKTQGVERIEAAGKQFDPAVHEAIMQRAEEDKEDNIVLEDFQAGYKLNDRVLRPSKVIVNKLPAEPQEDDEQQEREEE